MIFLIVLYLIKSKSNFQDYKSISNNTDDLSELTYSGQTIGDLVTQDTDGDGIPDWEENLWGTDPTKKETTEGVPDSKAIEKIKSTQLSQDSGLTLDNTGTSDENLTQTEKLSRDLFSTVGALSQNGSLDQETIDAITGSLADQIKNQQVEKIYALTDLKIVKKDDKQTFQNYNTAMQNIQKKHPINKTVVDVLQEFAPDENTVNIEALEGLTPIISQTKSIISDMAQMSVPQNIATLHLGVVNSLERLLENIQNIQLYDTDPVIAMGAISKYEENTNLLETAVKNLNDIVNKKLSN